MGDRLASARDLAGLCHAVAAFVSCWISHPKKRKEASAERMAILADVGLQFDAVAERKRLGCSWMEVDDLIDAAAMLVTAMRSTNAPPSGFLKRSDERRLRVAIWA